MADMLNIFADGSWTVTTGIDAEVEATHDDYVVSLVIAEILAEQAKVSEPRQSA